MITSRRKTRIGQVVSNKTNKTVLVAVRWRQQHPLYRKSIRRVSKFQAHDENNICQLGDQVQIIETRPLSKTKRWRVIQILESSKGAAELRAIALGDLDSYSGENISPDTTAEKTQESTATAEIQTEQEDGPEK
jgi:small subunit ribosomal protein S17